MENALPPVHPGAYVRRGLKALDLSNAQGAAILDCSRAFVGDIVNGKRGLSIEMCFKLAELLGSTPDFWVRLQAQYDVKMAQRNKKMLGAARKVRDRALAHRKLAAA